MRRRDFITLIGGAAVGWPQPARAQAVGKTAKIGLMAVARRSPETLPAYQVFLGELRAHGFVEGHNLVLLTRWIDEDAPSAVAAEFMQAAVDVIVVEASEIGVKSAVAAAPNIPIVMYANNYDPIERGYVRSSEVPRLAISRACSLASRN